MVNSERVTADEKEGVEDMRNRLETLEAQFQRVMQAV